MTENTVAEVTERLKREVGAILRRDPSEIGEEAPLHTLGMDSLSFVELLVFIEREFELKLVESGLTREDFQTIRALASCISELR